MLARAMAAPWPACLLLALIVAACASPTTTSPRPGDGPSVGKPYRVNGVRYVPKAQPGYDATGIASWYGGKFHGRRTASGQRYDMNAMTAAHRTLPFGTKVRVTNLRNDRTVILTVNDRGPFVHGRIIDVSRRAAERLGFRGRGTTRVRVQAVDGEPTLKSAAVRSTATPTGPTPVFQDALDKALERPRNTQTAWRDPDGAAYGVITPLTKPVTGGEPVCRNYRRTAVAGAARTTYLGRACRQPDRRWRIRRERQVDG